jgi:hypothetical protein
MNEVIPAKRSRFWLYAPLILILVLALAWSGVWFYAAGRAETTVAAWIDREANLGRRYACAERKVGGYPFRIEIRCRDLEIDFDTADGPVSLRSPQLLAMAQIYQPDLVIAEATGPMTVKAPGADIDHVATWSLLQASLRGRPAAPQRLSLVVTAPKLALPNGTDALANAKQFQFHAQRRAGGSNEEPFDLALRLDDLLFPGAPALASRPITVDAQGVLRGLKDLRPKPMNTRLREWQAAGGRIEVTQARIAQGDALAVGQGDLGLTADGRIDGVVNLKVAGLDQVAGLIFGEAQNRRQAGVIAGLNMLSRSELEGRRAVAVPLSFRDGRIFFGPVPVGRTKPLFQ